MNRVMREIGPVSNLPPAFPLAGGALAPLRAKAEAQGSSDFSPMWSGEAAALSNPKTCVIKPKCFGNAKIAITTNSGFNLRNAPDFCLRATYSQTTS